MTEIQKIVIAAIPLDSCPVKRAHAEWRRERLTEAINDLLKKEREKKEEVNY